MTHFVKAVLSILVIISLLIKVHSNVTSILG